MGLFKKSKNGGLADVIRCDETSYLIWKWRPSGVNLNETARENTIRRNSVLRVKDGEVAVFVYKQKDGTTQDFIVGPFDKTLKTANLPVLSSIIGIGYEGDTPFQAEVYFINLATIIQIKFAVPFFEVFDNFLTDYSVPIAVRGTISFKISDYKEFIKIHRLINFTLEDFKLQVKDVICRYVKDFVANAPMTENIPVLQIERKLGLVNDLVEEKLQSRLKKDFGICVSAVDIDALEIDKSSENYQKLIRITKDLKEIEIKAETDVAVKNLYDKQKIEAKNYEETLRVQREESQYAAHMHTRTENFSAYQVEKQAEVGIAGADALGKMGSNNAGSVDLGSGGIGFNPASIMTGIALGSVVGKNIAGIMDTALSTDISTPPPIPTVKFFVAKDEKPTGPFDLATLKAMTESGEFNKESLVWKNGMEAWKKADEIEALNEILKACPPPIK